MCAECAVLTLFYAIGLKPLSCSVFPLPYTKVVIYTLITRLRPLTTGNEYMLYGQAADANLRLPRIICFNRGANRANAKPAEDWGPPNTACMYTRLLYAYYAVHIHCMCMWVIRLAAWACRLVPSLNPRQAWLRSCA